MKNKLTTLVTCGLLLLSTSASAADGFYIGLGAGQAIQQSKSYGEKSGTYRDIMTFDNGLAAEAYFGYHFGWVKTELELSYAKHNAISDYVPNVAFPVLSRTYLLDGKATRWSYIGNILLTKNIQEWEFFVGPGLGISNVKWDINIINAPAYSGSDSVFTYQLIAGFNYPINDSIAFGMRYKYINGGNITVPASVSPATFAFPAAHNITANIEYKFD